MEANSKSRDKVAAHLLWDESKYGPCTKRKMRETKVTMEEHIKAARRAKALAECPHFEKGKCLSAVRGRNCGYMHKTDAAQWLCAHPRVNGACKFGERCLYAQPK